MNSFHFSIIIPHKNIPALLQRCLDSIPMREDIQVIVVDDNSDEGIVDFDRFPGLSRPNTEVYFDKSGKGAGHARNVGLEHAVGRWLIFADADDFFDSSFSACLDKYVDSSSDVIYFRFRAVQSEDISLPSKRDYDHLDKVFGPNQPEKYARLYYPMPWGKFIKRKLVIEHSMKFDETRWSNDMYFVLFVGCVASSIVRAYETMYVVTERAGSLISSFCRTEEELCVRTEVAIRTQTLLDKYGLNQERMFLTLFLKICYERNARLFHREFRYLSQCGVSTLRAWRELRNIWGWKRVLKIAFQFYIHPLR